jgi:hypothetical protein
MATTFTKPNSFDHSHTRGDTFYKRITVTNLANWTGYSSGKCEVRNSAGTLMYSLTVNISTSGVLILSNANPIDVAEGTYYIDIQWTMSDGKIKTWVNNDHTLYKAVITKQSSQ